MNINLVCILLSVVIAILAYMTYLLQMLRNKLAPKVLLWNYVLDSLPMEAPMVPAIKALREASGFGLKEAKDLCDLLRDGNKQKIFVGLTKEQCDLLDRQLGNHFEHHVEAA